MAGGSEVGSGHVSIFPVMTGFKSAVSKEMQAVGHEGSGIFGKAFNGVGSKTGSSLGRDMKSAFTGASKDMATPGLKKLESEVASAARAMSAARLKQQDAAGKVKVAEAQYAEAIKKSGEGSVQAVSASERLASAKRREQSTSETLTAAEKRLKDAKKAVADVKQATIEAPKVGPFESAVTRIRSAIQGLNAQRLDKAGSTVNGLGTAYQGVVGHVKASTVAIGSLLASGVRGIANYGRTAIDAYNEISGTTAKFQQIASNNHWAQDQTQALLAYNKELGRTGIISAGTLKASQAQLGTFMLSSQSVKTLTPALADLIANTKGYNATAEDGVQLSNLLGKVMTGNVGALSRYGVTLDENQKKLLAHGSQEERAATLAKVLEQNFGGVNKAMAATPYGKYVIMQHQLAAIKTTIGGGFIDAIGALGDMGVNVVDRINGKLDSFFKWLPNAVGGAVSLLRDGKVTNAFAQAFHVPDSARQGIENTVNHIRDSVKGLGDFLKSGTISKSFNEGFKGMDPKVVERFQDAMKRVREQITGTTKELRPFSGGMKDTKPGLDLATRGVETVTLALNTLSPTITIMEKLVKAFSSLPAPVQGAIGAGLLFGKQIRTIEAPIGLALKALEGLGKGAKSVGGILADFVSSRVSSSAGLASLAADFSGIGKSASLASPNVSGLAKSAEEMGSKAGKAGGGVSGLLGPLGGLGAGGWAAAAGIAAVTGGFLLWADHAAKAKERTTDLESALQQGQTAYSDFVDTAATKGTDMDWGWFQKFRSGYGSFKEELSGAGVSMQTFRGAIEGDKGSIDSYVQSLEKSTGQGDKHNGVVEEGVRKLAQMNHAYNDAVWQQNQMAGSAENLSRIQQDLSNKLSGLSTTVKANGGSLDANTQSGQLNRQAMQGMADQSIATAAAIMQQGQANGNLGQASQDARNSIYQARQAMVDAAQQCGMSKEQAEEYADQLGLIPSHVGTDISQNSPLSKGQVEQYLDTLKLTPKTKDTVMNAFNSGALHNIGDVDNAIRAVPRQKDTDLNAYDHASRVVQNILNWFRQIPNEIVTYFSGKPAGKFEGGPVGRANGGPVGFAYGGGPYGLVRGPGTTTSDSIPVMLSDQEYVIKARSARSIGLAALDRMNRTGKVEPSTSTVVSPTVIQPVTITNNGIRDPFVEGTILGRQMASSARMTLRRMA